MSEQPENAPPPADASASPATPDDLWARLRHVVDPELHVNIVDLGLVYGIEIKEGLAEVRMTLTTPGCPYGPYLLHEVDANLVAAPGIEKVDIQVVWDPPWGPDKMTEEIRLELGFDV